MTDYANTFGGAAQDAASATILGAEWDTEYANIATAVATKQDKITSPTTGNLIELDGSGVPTDAGVVSGNLDGLTGVVETRLAAAEAGIDTRASAPSGMYRVGNMYLFDLSAGVASFGATGISTSSWESVGDGAAGLDWTWTALNEIPGSHTPTSLIINLFIEGSDSGAASQQRLYGAKYNETSTVIDGGTMMAHQKGDRGSNVTLGHLSTVQVPCSTDGSILLRRYNINVTSSEMSMFLMGWTVDS